MFCECRNIKRGKMILHLRVKLAAHMLRIVIVKKITVCGL